ncbi:Stk1 family PASTA domain-containing Ser/Thr kinase [Microbacterium sp. ZXX196]|uniref:Stk1 family PASTA domain-containing Ser/Thr kinase n=1 Tax=Microbacterium sp. ZXX196 TaxID=2609291 RepID=UPI0013251466|nr:Stk1 family PASTA domain-containing Ser/Thr kinase [Microbacterium sp. ZXX196]
MSSRPPADPLLGRLVDGRYRVRGRIARGGMATVYLATDLRLERRVALKVMHHHLSDDDRFQSRFIQEARAAARLSDPHVVSVFDQGQDGEIAYLVMEYLAGITLRDLLAEQTRLSLSQTITIMDAVLSGLASAHRAGFIHRDVKPENVLLAEDGRVKIGDFGLARATSANTATGQQLLGTIAYLAPELVTQGSADARTDIYALGIMLYEMLTGAQPYTGEQPMQIAYQHATEQVPRPSIRNPEVPEPLDELVLWATEREPDERPADAQEMLDRLREIEHQIGVHPLPTRGRLAARAAEDLLGENATKLLAPEDDEPGATAILAPTLAVPGPTASDQNAERLRVRTRRRTVRGWWAAIIVLFLALAAGGTGWWFGSGPGSMIVVPSFAEDATFDDAAAALTALELVPAEESETSIDVPAGRILDVTPASGTPVYPGQRVTIVTSLGPAAVEVESLRGLPQDEAADLAEEQRLRVADDVSERFDSAEAGTVLAARVSPRGSGDPYACGDGCSAHEGDAIAFTVSAGAVPDVENVTVAEARDRLEDVGLVVADATEQRYSDAIEEGRVIALVDPGEQALSPGDTVTLIESLGPEPFPVPDVVGLTRDEAIAALENAGFVADHSALWSVFPNGLTTVTGTDPGPESMHPLGTEIYLQISATG